MTSSFTNNAAHVPSGEGATGKAPSYFAPAIGSAGSWTPTTPTTTFRAGAPGNSSSNSTPATTTATSSASNPSFGPPPTSSTDAQTSATTTPEVSFAPASNSRSTSSTATTPATPTATTRLRDLNNISSFSFSFSAPPLSRSTIDPAYSTTSSRAVQSKPPVTAAAAVAAARLAHLHHKDTLNLHQNQPAPTDQDQQRHDSITTQSIQDSPSIFAPAARQPHQRRRRLDNDYSSADTAASEPIKSSPARSRASTLQTSSASTSITSPSANSGSGSLNAKRSLSFDVPVIPDAGLGPTDSTETIVDAHPNKKRASATWSSTPGDPSSSASGAQRQHARADDFAPLDNTKDWAQGQLDLILPKSVKRPMSDDRNSVTRRPPVSYKPRASASISNNSGGSAAIPPIRSFRSSGSRKSLTLDMDFQSPQSTDAPNYPESGHRDRSLRALEGMNDDYTQQTTAPDSSGIRADNEDTGDMFLRIAHEDESRRRPDERVYADGRGTVSRVARSDRRPLSTVGSSFEPRSPPRLTRRLSDHQSSSQRYGDDPGNGLARTLTYRGHSRDRASEDLRPRASSQAPREGPFTPRSLGFTEIPPGELSSGYTRRRQPSVDAAAAAHSRMASLKQSAAASNNNRSYHSSPLAHKAADQQGNDAQQGEVIHQSIEGTNSTSSTAPPSGLWDELDELKSRIHRLELTGKLPPSSGGPASRSSDERPPTATTNATTMSASPKRGSASVAQAADAVSNVSSERRKESHPLLHAALSKSKQILAPDVYSALETAASDALSLSSMMGTAGQPGPISSATSVVAGGPPVTDRQLRRKTDSICRSITELCLALSEGAVQTRLQQLPPEPPSRAPPEPPLKSPLASPRVTSPTFKFSNMPNTRRSSVVDRSITVNSTNSPRTGARYEDRKSGMLPNSALPSPRFNSVTTPTEGNPNGRKSSLYLSRSRTRAQTEEPEETGRRSSVLRTRRAGTEEPEDHSERPSLLPRGRRATIENDEDGFRAPSRANTDVQGGRSHARDYHSQLPAPPSQDAGALGSSALPRRRLTSTNQINTRLVQPAVSSGMGQRRYLERTPDRETHPHGDRLFEDRGHRQMPIGQASTIDRALSLKRPPPNRHSVIATTSPAGQAYR